MIATEAPICIITMNVVAHTFAAETVTCICGAETSNCIIATESHLDNCNRKIHQHTSNRKYHLKTCKNATDVTCIIAIESVSCIVPTETATCRIDYRNFHLQKWCQSEILLVIIKTLVNILAKTPYFFRTRQILEPLFLPCFFISEKLVIVIISVIIFTYNFVEY